MSNALSIKPMEPDDVPAAGTTEAARPAGVRPVHGRSRISADSFKLLTAKLRGAAPSALAAPQALAIGAEVTIATLAVTREVIEPADTVIAQAPVEALETALPPPAWISSADEADLPDRITLPEFRPIEMFQSASPEPQSGEDHSASSSSGSERILPIVGTVDEDPALVPADFIDYGEEFPDLLDVAAPGDVDSLQLPVFAPISFGGYNSGLAMPQAAEPEALAPVEPEPELEPQPEPALHAVTVFEEPNPEPESSVELDALHAVEPEVEPEPELAFEPEPEFVPEPAPQPELAAMPEAEAPVIAPPAELEPDEGPKPPTPASAIAERVVDAMLKTISGAIYAKPSTSERAAFLREVAELMESDGLAPAPAAHIPAVPRPPVVAMAPQSVTVASEPDPGIAPDAPLAEVLASRMGPGAPLLRSATETDDPFTLPASKLKLLADPKPAETIDADPDSGELALTLLDMMSSGSGSALPHERTLAADTLLRILPRIPVKQLLAVVERVAIMETPPALLVAKLIRDSRAEVVSPLLERCSHISDQDLMSAAPVTDTAKLRMIARRRKLSTVLSDYLIDIGEPSVLLTLIRNPGAAFSHDAFFRLAEHASQHHALLAPLATRADLPPPVAFELFWHVPQELRRFIFSRFLTDSETLNKILRITLATHGAEGDAAPGEPKFPAKELIDAAIERAAAFKLDEAAHQLAEIGGIAAETALRILTDREGEPIAVLLKGLGYPRSRLDDVLSRLRHPDAGLMRADRNPEEIQAIFDGLSFNKARILLTYWDWFMRKAGPYAPHS